MIISILNNKGGVGKTCTAVNLSACLVAEGKKVLYVDLDKQGNGTSNFSIDKLKLNLSIYHLFKKFDFSEYFHHKTNDVINKTSTGVDVIPANLKLENVEYEIIGRPMREFILKKMLMEIKDNYDFIVIDCPPSLGILVQNALVASDYFIIPTQPESSSLEGIPAIVETYKDIRSTYNPNLRVLGVLMTMTNKRTKSYTDAKNELTSAFGNVMFESEIRRSIKASDSHAAGKSLIEFDKNGDITKDYINLTKEVIERTNK